MEEKKLTDDEIVKGLDFCTTYEDCEECEYDDIAGCRSFLMRNALDIIHRLQDENESLKKQIDELPKPRKKILANKVYADSTLKKWNKEDLIEQIRILEHNWASAEESLNNSVKNSEKIFFEQKAEIERLEKAVLDKVSRNEELIKDIERLTKENVNVISMNDALYREKAELQKQVDELKLDLENWKKAAYGYKHAEEQAVKDTAKEILQEFDKDDGTTFVNKLRRIKERYSVEVE